MPIPLIECSGGGGVGGGFGGVDATGGGSTAEGGLFNSLSEPPPQALNIKTDNAQISAFVSILPLYFIIVIPFPYDCSFMISQKQSYVY
jgi:hypothetical protein